MMQTTSEPDIPRPGAATALAALSAAVSAGCVWAALAPGPGLGWAALAALAAALAAACAIGRVTVDWEGEAAARQRLLRHWTTEEIARCRRVGWEYWGGRDGMPPKEIGIRADQFIGFDVVAPENGVEFASPE